MPNVTEEQVVEVVKKKRPNKSAQMQIQAKPGDNAHYLAHSMELYELPLIDRTNPDEVGERTKEYFTICFKNDMKPTVAGYALALGCSRVELFRIENGETKSAPPSVRNIVKRAKNLITAELEDYMQNGKINPVSGIFLLKNSNGHYRDQTDVVVSPGSVETDEKTLIQDADLLPDV